MKLYIVGPDKAGTSDREGMYNLVSEKGELLDYHYCTNREFAKMDLYYRNEKIKKECEEKFGEDVVVLNLGDDFMTNAYLKELNGKFNKS